MQVSTGNIYTEQEWKDLGIPESDLVPLSDEEATRILNERRSQARALKSARRNKKPWER